jgi:hypothetical protein
MYAILKMAWSFTTSKQATIFRTVEILCEKFYARMILAAAEIYCPEAAAEIEESIRLSRTLH